jgi:hypothetical protein
MLKKKKKYDYYKLDVGFYPDVMKLCFDNKVFQEILKDHDIKLKTSALDIGMAETHQIGDGKEGIIILVFDLSDMGDDMGLIVDTIAHEVSHAVDHLAEFIGEENNFVGETRAYLTGSLMKQIFKITMSEKDKNVRKANRKVLSKKSSRVGRDNVQVDQHGLGGARSHSLAELESIVRRAENGDGQTVRPPDPSV